MIRIILDIDYMGKHIRYKSIDVKNEDLESAVLTEDGKINKNTGLSVHAVELIEDTVVVKEPCVESGDIGFESKSNFYKIEKALKQIEGIKSRYPSNDEFLHLSRASLMGLLEEVEDILK